MLFNKFIVTYSEDHMKPINTICEQNSGTRNVKEGGTSGYHRSLRGLRSPPLPVTGC
jgi:hypothetical protein